MRTLCGEMAAPLQVINSSLRTKVTLNREIEGSIVQTLLDSAMPEAVDMDQYLSFRV